MEERNNRSNTMLLTIIAIATLLVAVIGATFAYFTAQITGRETFSTITVGASTLTITFADNSSTLVSNTDIVPTKSVNGTFDPVITKNFTLSGVNTTTDMDMPYELYLIVDNNTFQLEDRGTDTYTSLTYKLVVSGGGSAADGQIESSTAYGNIPATAVASSCNGTYCDGQVHGGETYEYLQATPMGTVTVYDNTGAVLINAQQGIKLGTGYFPANTTTAATHYYTLNIYFNETGKNQDFDKNKEFEGYVVVNVGNQAINGDHFTGNCTETTSC